MQALDNKTPTVEFLFEEKMIACFPLLFSGKKYCVGRDPDNDLVISHEQISRHHLTIYRGWDNTVIIQDLKSTNGISVNGAFITEPTEIRASDIIGIGTIAIRLKCEVAVESDDELSSSMQPKPNSALSAFLNNPNGLLALGGIFLLVASVLFFYALQAD